MLRAKMGGSRPYESRFSHYATLLRIENPVENVAPRHVRFVESRENTWIAMRHGSLHRLGERVGWVGICRNN